MSEGYFRRRNRKIKRLAIAAAVLIAVFSAATFWFQHEKEKKDAQYGDLAEVTAPQADTLEEKPEEKQLPLNCLVVDTGDGLSVLVDCGSSEVLYDTGGRETSGKVVKAIDEFIDGKLPAFSRRTFGMFGGETQTVTIRCRENLLGVIVDRFGTDVLIVNTNDGWYQVRQTITVSNQFYGWLFGLGKDVQILGPQTTVNGYVKRLEEEVCMYRCPVARKDH